MSQDWQETAEAARESGRPVEAGSTPTLWGEALHGAKNPLVLRGCVEIENATSFDHASDIVGAFLIEQLSAWQRTSADFFYLSVRRALEEFQIDGALAALSSAKEEALVQHIGLSVEGPALAVASMWRFHDAFETVMVKRNPACEDDYQQVKQTADSRRVGVVTRSPFDWGSGRFFGDDEWQLGAAYLSLLARGNPVIVSVESASQITRCIDAERAVVDDSIDFSEIYGRYQAAGASYAKP